MGRSEGVAIAGAALAAAAVAAVRGSLLHVPTVPSGAVHGSNTLNGDTAWGVLGATASNTHSTSSNRRRIVGCVCWRRELDAADVVLHALHTF
jgi:hypothetical protein